MNIVEPVRDEREGLELEGRYRLDHRIGEGGMGAVYSGTQLGLGRRVAIKVLHPEVAKNENLLARFRREAELAASLGHPNIVQVTDFGHAEGDPEGEGAAYLVMDYVEGRSLAQALAAEGPFPPERAAFVATQVLSALGAAHAAGVVHRDLKPDNILLTRVSGVADVVKLLDFGIARLADTGDQKMTATGQVLGTPAYMSPEQARGREVDLRTDLYALGVLLYEILAGRLPFSGDNYHQLMFAIVDEEPPPLSALKTELDPTLVAVIHRALAKDPDSRFASAEEMSAALAPYAKASVGLAPSVTEERIIPTTRVGTPVAFDPTLTPEAAVAIGVGTPQPAPDPFGPAGGTTTPDAVPRKSTNKKRKRQRWIRMALASAAGVGAIVFAMVEVPGREGAMQEMTQLESPGEAAEESGGGFAEESARAPAQESVAAADPEPAPTSTHEQTAIAVAVADPAPSEPPATQAAPGSTRRRRSVRRQSAAMATSGRGGGSTQTGAESDLLAAQAAPPRAVVRFTGGVTNNLWSVDEFRAAINRGSRAFSRCYEEREFQMRNWIITLAPEGSVMAVRVGGSNQPDDAERACMEAAIRRLRFPPLAEGHGDEATFWLRRRSP